mmetsp:Transcript_93784/g.270999  ORF Transcript_93784/g.270999 Transcript_93784/m.270999 type:complete len:202 (-) Transcript_93784:708-1313(-)
MLVASFLHRHHELLGLERPLIGHHIQACACYENDRNYSHLVHIHECAAFDLLEHGGRDETPNDVQLARPELGIRTVVVLHRGMLDRWKSVLRLIHAIKQMVLWPGLDPLAFYNTTLDELPSLWAQACLPFARKLLSDRYLLKGGTRNQVLAARHGGLGRRLAANLEDADLAATDTDDQAESDIVHTCFEVGQPFVDLDAAS